MKSDVVVVIGPGQIGQAIARRVGASKQVLLADKRVENANLAEAKTKALAAQFSGLGLQNALIIDGAELNQNFAIAARNIPNIDVLPIQGINVYDILRRQKLVLTKAALDALEARFK